MTPEKPPIDRIELNADKHVMRFFRQNSDECSYIVCFSALKLMIFEQGALFEEDNNVKVAMKYIAEKVVPPEVKFIPKQYLENIAKLGELDDDLRHSIDTQLQQLPQHTKTIFYDHRRVLS